MYLIVFYRYVFLLTYSNMLCLCNSPLSLYSPLLISTLSWIVKCLNKVYGFYFLDNLYIFASLTSFIILYVRCYITSPCIPNENCKIMWYDLKFLTSIHIYFNDTFWAWFWVSTEWRYYSDYLANFILSWGYLVSR